MTMQTKMRFKPGLEFVVVLFTLLICSAHADNTESAGTLSSNLQAQALLRKIQAAAQKLNYSGTFVYQQSNQMHTSSIAHLREGKNELEKLEVLDGKPREYLRNNEEVSCYMPETKTVMVEERVTPDVFPALLAANPVDLTEHYNIRSGMIDRIAGRDCQAIVLEPKDNLRYGYKLWADKTTGLLLRAQTLNEKGDVVEQIAFTQVAIGNIDPKQVKSSFPNTDGWRVERAKMSRADLTGWSVKGIPPGFKKIRELKRRVSEAPAGNAPNNQAQSHDVSQMVFSDGLAAISVFIEPDSQKRTEGTMQQGSMNIVAKRQDGYWLTVVGEVPAAAIVQVANSIEFDGK